MTNCIIIDDEPRARNLLSAIIEQYCPALSVKEMCEDLPSGIKAIKKHKPQLIFLDIELPGHSGLELMDFFNDDEIDFSIIFTTAYNEYALQAFRFSAIDYLLKPIQHLQLVEAVNRFLKQQEQKQALQLRLLQENLQSMVNLDDRRIIVPTGQSMRILKFMDILMIKAEAAYSELYLADGTTILASRNLKHFEDTLSQIPIFFRCHKSYIVNLRMVEEYVKSEGGYLKLSGGLTAYISAEKVDEFLAKVR